MLVAQNKVPVSNSRWENSIQNKVPVSNFRWEYISVKYRISGPPAAKTTGASKIYKKPPAAKSKTTGGKIEPPARFFELHISIVSVEFLRYRELELFVSVFKHLYKFCNCMKSNSIHYLNHEIH